MVRVAGVEPAWTCAQDMWVAATLHPDLKRGPCSPLMFSPSRTPPGAACGRSPPGRLRGHHGVDRLVRHRRLVDHVGVLAALDARRRLGVVLHGEAALRLACATSRGRRRGCRLTKLSGLPLPRTMNERAPMLPGMMPSSPSRARTAPLRVTNTSRRSGAPWPRSCGGSSRPPPSPRTPGASPELCTAAITCAIISSRLAARSPAPSPRPRRSRRSARCPPQVREVLVRQVDHHRRMSSFASSMK